MNKSRRSKLLASLDNFTLPALHIKAVNSGWKPEAAPADNAKVVKSYNDR